MRVFESPALLGSFFLIGVLSLLGCGKSEPLPGPQPYPVTGTVMYAGKPAASFRVVFHPVEKFEGPQFAPSAMTDEQGNFALHSYSKEEPDGAPAGEYVVTFQCPMYVSTGDDDELPLERDRLRGKFNNPQKSKWKAQVVEGENDLETFELK
ncbi:carboxypeptidase-like regulatory domain-containing protein [Blastopirellula sp. J2-11]|uniref:carboxypeptidase-like regulatory domain-containing protein n=1 Tax=Blastopirellula sp. J2-11 TaxID=2943192 RepID=UPI0021C69965|nr:carboxypeptidase-like regulatory domain-containing protein [Blastopirellula sp. J2-11]UUO04569.1 carboxypeptidase-like regulatory domain-containing protein [Blastopirellula sp. J2-11]